MGRLEMMRPVLGAVVLVGLASPSVFADTPAIDHVSARAISPQYDGTCPVSIDFTARIFVNYPTKVTYRWERGDHVMSHVEMAFVNGAGRDIKGHWRISAAPGGGVDGVNTLHVLFPVNAYSNPAEFHVTCR
jgi:hypothetical protein